MFSLSSQQKAHTKKERGIEIERLYATFACWATTSHQIERFDQRSTNKNLPNSSATMRIVTDIVE